MIIKYNISIEADTQAQTVEAMEALVKIKKNLTHEQLVKLANATDNKSKVAMAMKWI